MFIPSMYKSVPQSLSVTAGGSPYTITSVNTNFSRLSIIGWESTDQSGAVNDVIGLRASFLSSTSVQINGGGVGHLLVEEFFGGFFLQNFFYGICTISGSSVTATNSTGLTLGAKAFVVTPGQSESIGVVGSKAVAQATATLSLNTGTGVVTATRFEGLNPGAGDTGDLIVGFCVIDPR